MRKNILDEALKIINERRFDAENVAKINKLKALENKEFKTLYNQYIDNVIENAKTGGKDKIVENLQKKLEILRQKFKIGEIEPNYYCKECNDTGFIEGKYCKCLTKEINNILLEQSGFGKLENFSDANFDIHSKPEFIQKLYKLMKEWCHSDFNKNLVFLSGQTGVGKTHLARCMAKELIDLGNVVYLTTSFAMNQDFLKSYASRDLEEKDFILQKYLSADVLFIDDMGTELRQPGITTNYFYQVINERKMNKKPTVITSNLTLSDMQDYYDERISSRITDLNSSICIYIDGVDLRLKKL